MLPFQEGRKKRSEICAPIETSDVSLKNAVRPEAWVHEVLFARSFNGANAVLRATDRNVSPLAPEGSIGAYVRPAPEGPIGAYLRPAHEEPIGKPLRLAPEGPSGKPL